MKVSLGNKPLIYPQPVLVVATYNEDSTANAMTAAWGSVFDYSKIALIIDKGHKTLKNILTQKAFTVSIADKQTLVAADYVGIVSGNQEKDKVTKAGLHYEASSKVNAPVITEFPLTLECTLISFDEKTEQVIGEVVNTLADETILTENKIDLSKFFPLVYDAMNHDYVTLGEKVGKAFQSGKVLE